MTHSCIKCTTQYEDEEVDAYYCASCLTAHKEKAQTIDADIAKTDKHEPMSDYKAYMMSTDKARGFLRVSL